MSPTDSLATRLREVYRRSERKLIVGYLLALASLVLLLAAGPVRRPVLGAAERVAASWDDRWSRRLAEAEALVQAGALDSAVVYLERLDAEFPARHVKHARDAERQRLLRALGSSYRQLGRNERALLTYRRLVAFEPRSIANYYDLAQACIDAGETAEARQHLLSALAIDPNHLPSLRSYVKLAYDVADYPRVVTAYRTYLAAFMAHELTLQVGDTAMVVKVPVDGVFHDVAWQPLSPDWQGQLSAETGGLQVEINQITLHPLLVVGRVSAEPTELRPPGGASWLLTPRAAADTTAPPVSSFTLPVKVAASTVERLELRVKLRKPVDPVLWSMVERSYRNLLDTDGLTEARAMSYVLPTLAAADAIRRPE